MFNLDDIMEIFEGNGNRKGKKVVKGHYGHNDQYGEDDHNYHHASRPPANGARRHRHDDDDDESPFGRFFG